MKKLILLVLILGVLGLKNTFADATGSPLDLTKAVIHHSATPDVSIKVIRRYHMEHNGWDDVGYHFLIRQDGRIEIGRSLMKKGAHAPGRNHYIGICLTGEDKFTVAQVKSLITLLNDLGVRHIERHHEECPGPGLDLDYVRKHLGKVQMVGKASYYTDTITANGERFEKDSFSCATLTGNYGMKFKVTNIKTGKWIIVRNNDHGPHTKGRIIDLTPNAFKQLADLKTGVMNVKVETFLK